MFAYPTIPAATNLAQKNYLSDVLLMLLSREWSNAPAGIIHWRKYQQPRPDASLNQLVRQSVQELLQMSRLQLLILFPCYEPQSQKLLQRYGHQDSKDSLSGD